MLRKRELKKKAIGFKKGNQNFISSMYNIRYDLNLGVSKTAVRSIRCACNSCIEQLTLPQDKNAKYCNQKRDNVNNNCLHWNNFESLNDWNIITLVITNKNNTEKDNEVF